MGKDKQPLPRWLERKRARMPQNRSWSEVVDVLCGLLPDRPVWLLCYGCRGHHPVSDARLIIRCSCGEVTVYRDQALFYLWTGLTWTRLLWLNPYALLASPYVEALKHYGSPSSRPYPEPNTRMTIVTPRGAAFMNTWPISTPVDLRVTAWRSRQR